MTPARRLSAACTASALVLALAVGLVGSTTSPAAAQTEPGPPPTGMASLGDSIARGFNACGFYVDCTSRSFSTGDHGSIDSHYLRIRAIDPSISGNNFNHARSGARVGDLPGQAAAAVARGPDEVDYVTILIGANDACTSNEASMTPVATFRTRLDEALGVLRTGLPEARVLLISIPDIHQLWNIGRTSFGARTAWSLFGTCRTMLANPGSFADADVARRDRVRQRVVGYNAELAAACTAFGPLCRFDGNAVFDYPFQLAQVSGWDYFHPNAAGQAVLAEISYTAGFRW